jgi:uncharacterized protein YjbI with pentapeptide repeats
MRIIANKIFKTPEEVKEALVNGPVRFSYCNFDELDLTTVVFNYCIFEAHCSFVKTKLGSAIHSEWYSCNFLYTDFTKADISWAFASGCKIDGIKFMGVRRTEDCFFMGGLESNEADGWRALWTGTLIKSPIQDKIREQLPNKYKLLIKTQFALGERNRQASFMSFKKNV